ncbi:Hypp4176 [Branchiostoma lanceolatum]|uniref:Hypp4176 protein n=1 Tax=Branchiostoma lanceolatum TaxID=7740 RepID=A0A8K0A8L5_BRALA|nr:Hypp4176 [Branchiostoma lanceolatum]
MQLRENHWDYLDRSPEGRKRVTSGWDISGTTDNGSPPEEQEDVRRRLEDMETALKTVSLQLKSMGVTLVQQSKAPPVHKP